jgi:DNA-binding transcriptional MocR family regulator
MNAVEIVCQALLGAGSKAVAITPSWPNIMRAMTINGADVTEVPLRRSNRGWSLDMAAVEAACSEGVRMLYLASPANPTGDLVIPVERGDNHVEDHFRRAACSFRSRRSRAGRWPSQDHASAGR